MSTIVRDCSIIQASSRMERPTVEPCKPGDEGGSLPSSTGSKDSERPNRCPSSVSSASGPCRGNFDPSAERVDESEEAATLMADIKTATGFASYEAYMESLRNDPAYPVSIRNNKFEP